MLNKQIFKQNKLKIFLSNSAKIIVVIKIPYQYKKIYKNFQLEIKNFVIQLMNRFLNFNNFLLLKRLGLNLT